MILHWPQITFLVLTIFGFGVSVHQTSTGEKPVREFYCLLVGIAIQLGLLYAGGFFG